MSRFSATLCALAGLTIALAFTPAQPASAQPEQTVCLSRPIGEILPGQSVSLAVFSQNAPALQAKGFVIKACEEEPQQRAALHDDACRLASVAPPTVQARFEERYGVTPAELCALTAAAGGN